MTPSRSSVRLGLSAALCLLGVVTHAAETPTDGKAIYEKTCAACHASGLAGAPKFGDAQEWKARISRGAGALFLSVFRGKNAMPPKGGDATLSNVEVEAAVVYLVSQSTGIPAAKVATLPASPQAERAAAPLPSQPAQSATQTAQTLSAVSGDTAKGKRVYDTNCAACHASGAAGAPKLADASAWAPRLKAGMRALYDSALKGKNAMPAKGGNASLQEAEVTAAVSYMVSRVPPSEPPAADEAKRDSAANATAAEPKPSASQAAASQAPKGKAVYQATCAACHATGLAGAPKSGDAAAWEVRIKSGKPALYASALKGKNAMPAKGGNATLVDAEVKAAVDFMLAQLKGASAPKATAASAPVAQPAQSAAADAAAPASGGGGEAIYQNTCAACHGSGLAGAPKLGDGMAWTERTKAGVERLYESALKGKNAMPAKGGNAALGESEIKAAVDYMLAQAGTDIKKLDTSALSKQVATPSAATATAAADAPKSDVTITGTTSEQATNLNTEAVLPPANPSAGTSASAQAAAPSAAPAPAPATPAAAAAVDPNSFNRLLKPAGKRNLPAAESGIHDPSNDGTHLLQAPLQAFGALPRSNAGNQIDWVKALNEGKINPRMDKTDPAVEALVLDMNIVREVKGSMPDVVYPHKQHTQWLDCSNCHPAIFIPQKGANQISMAAILLGQKCGVCHGKVAFPVSECRLCHSKNKETKVGETKP